MAEEIKSKFGKQIGISRFDNWEIVSNKKYLTLIWLDKIEKISPMMVPKSNGAGWIVVKEA